MAAKHLIGLDIGSKVVKAAQVTRYPGKPPRYVVTEFAKAAVDPQIPLPNLIRDLLNTKSFRTRFAATGLSGKNVFVRHHTMALIDDPQELKEAAKYEIGKFIPIQDVNELIYDCHKLEELPPNEKGEKEMRVLIAGVKKPHLDTWISTLEAAGAFPDIIDVDSCALGNVYSLLGYCKPDQVNPAKIVALVDIGASKVNVHIIKGDNSFFARESYKAGEDVTDAISKKFGVEMKDAEQIKLNPGDDLLKVLEAIETVVFDLCNDVKSSIDYFEAQYDAQVDEVLVTGGGSNTPGLLENLEKTLQKKITKWSPLDFFDKELSAESEKTATESGSQSAIALGLAARIAEEDFAKAA